jgi:DNA-binding transcriptional LysR family regulator
MTPSPAVTWRRKMYPNATPMMQVEGVMGMLSVLGTSGGQGLLPCFAGERTPAVCRVGPPVAKNELWLLVHADLRRSARVRAVTNFLVPRLQADRARFEEVPANNGAP